MGHLCKMIGSRRHVVWKTTGSVVSARKYTTCSNNTGAGIRPIHGNSGIDSAIYGLVISKAPKPVTRRILLPLSCALLLWAGCSGDTAIVDVDEDERGAPLSTSTLQTVTIEEIEALGIPVTAQSAVDLVSLTYRTVDAGGAPTVASALLAVPTRRTGSLALVSYQHGTEVRKDAVGSVRGLETPETAVPLIFATSGYLAIMPDYLGLGASPGLHPFVHAESLASAVIDALRAARHFARQEDIGLEEEIYLIGYSEGGYATAAAQREIEARHAGEFSIGASAPMAGPYDLSGSMVEVFATAEPYPARYYLPYTLLAYDEVYDLADSPSEYLAPPYDTTIPPLFDGMHGGGEIDAMLPVIPRDMLDTTWVSKMLGPETFLWRTRLEENDLLNWTPRSRTRLYHCENDDQIPYDNAVAALESFTGGMASANVDLVSGDYGTHAECAPVLLLFGKFWIDGQRSGVTKAETEAIATTPSRRWLRWPGAH